MKTRFAITCTRKGNRALAFRNIAASHFDTKEAAEIALASFYKNTGHTVMELFPDARVDPVECYDHGEAVRTVFS